MDIPSTPRHAPDSWTVACRLDELTPDLPLAVRLSGVPICLVRTGGEVFAVHDACTHGAVPLSDGEVADGTIECALHGSRFDLRTGRVLDLPATVPVRTYPVTVIDGVVRLEIAYPQRRTTEIGQPKGTS